MTALAARFDGVDEAVSERPASLAAGSSEIALVVLGEVRRASTVAPVGRRI
jgi:hypothetical protein